MSARPQILFPERPAHRQVFLHYGADKPVWTAEQSLHNYQFPTIFSLKHFCFFLWVANLMALIKFVFRQFIGLEPNVA